MPWQGVAWRIFVGQLLSFAVSLTGVFSSLLAQQKTSVSLLQSATSYLLIFIVVAPLHYSYSKSRHAAEQAARVQRQFQARTTAAAAAATSGGAAVQASQQNTIQQEQEQQHQPWYRHGFPGFFSSQFPLWRYFVLSIFDVSASFFAIQAYQNTDITSAQLLDDATIVTVMVLGYVFLQRRFNWRHFAGVAVAVGGMVGLVMADADNASRDSAKTAPNPVLGDTMMLIAATLYGFTNVGCECLLKSDKVVVPEWIRRKCNSVSSTLCCCCCDSGELESDQVAVIDSVSEQRQQQQQQQEGEDQQETTEEQEEQWGSLSDVLRSADLIIEYVTFLVLFGFILSFIALLSFSTGEVKDVGSRWAWHSTLYQLAFNCSMVFTYVGLPVVLKLTSSTFTVLSLLSADFFSVLMNWIVNGVAPTALYYVMAAVILFGTMVFDTAEKELPCSAKNSEAAVDTGRSRKDIVAAVDAIEHEQHGRN